MMLLNLSRSMPVLLRAVILACQPRPVRSHAYARSDAHVRNNTSYAFTAPTILDVVDANEVEMPVKPDSWDRYVENGLKSYRQWQEATLDVPFPTNPATVFSISLEGLSGWDSNSPPILHELHKSTDSNDWIEVKAEEDCPAPKSSAANLHNMLSVNQGVLICFWNYRMDLPKEWTIAQIASWSWQKAVANANPGTNPAHLDLSDLEYVIGVGIQNEKATLRMLYALSLVDAEPGDTTFDFKEPPTKGIPSPKEQPFWALSASPNGKTIIQILALFKRSMQNKRLKSVTVRWEK